MSCLQEAMDNTSTEVNLTTKKFELFTRELYQCFDGMVEEKGTEMTSRDVDICLQNFRKEGDTLLEEFKLDMVKLKEKEAKELEAKTDKEEVVSN